MANRILALPAELTNTRRMDIGAQVLLPGDRCIAFGRVVASAGGTVTFEPSQARMYAPPLARLFAHDRGYQPLLPSTRWFAYPLIGADLANLMGRMERGGRVEGSATLEVVWRPEGLEVVNQWDANTQFSPVAPFTVPPCPAPVGGWPQRGLPSLPAAYEGLRRAGLVGPATAFYPPGGGAVLVLCAFELERVLADLGDDLDPSICVVPSRYSQKVMGSVNRDIEANFEAWQCFSWRQLSNEDGQAVVEMRLVRILPELAEWATGLPDGLLQVDPWLARER